MGKGRAPCCDKENVKRGPWSPSEDMRLITFIQKYGHQNWRSLPKQAGLVRCGKSCRLRWINYLRPDVKRGNFTKEEEETIMRLHQALGNKWSKIAAHLPGRTDNEIKNVWNTHLKKRLVPKNENIRQSKKAPTAATSPSSSCVTLVSSSSGEKPSETFAMAVSVKADDFKTDSGSPSEGLEGLSSPSFTSNITNPGQVYLPNPEDQAAGSLANFIGGCYDANNSPSEGPEGLSSPSFTSNITNPGQVYVPIPEDQAAGSLVNFIGGCYDANNNTSEEVNKPNIFSGINFDIPFESDLDFWNMLDSLEPFQPEEIQGTHNSNFGEAETDKWLLELEHDQLGLESKDAGVAEPLVPEMNDKVMWPEAEMGMGPYQNITVNPYESVSNK